MSRQAQYPKYSILGVEVDAIGIDDAVTYITDWVSDSTKPPAIAVKPYVEFMDRSHLDSEVRDILNQAQLCLPDGVALQWAAHFLYTTRRRLWDLVWSGAGIVLSPKAITTPIPERFSGINFTLKLLRQCEAQGLSVFLVGSPRGTNISHTATTLRKRYPGLVISGFFPGYFSASGESQLTDQLIQQRPDIILIGVGFPKQERLATRLAAALNHGFLIGEGGSFDYQELGGKRHRAPSWVQAIGLEWFWRLLLEPSRWKRQLAIPRFIWQIWAQKA